jgi:hypothetical protein
VSTSVAVRDCALSRAEVQRHEQSRVLGASGQPMWSARRRALPRDQVGFQGGSQVDLREYAEALAREGLAYGCLGRFHGQLGGRLDGAHGQFPEVAANRVRPSSASMA